MKIYTKTGDSGDTALYGGSRRSKSDTRVAAYGDIDELQAHLGVVGAMEGSESIRESLLTIQHDLFVLSSELARTESKPSRNDPVLSEDRVAWVESGIDALDQETKPLTNFILQGGHPVAAQLFLARAVCRRAERAIVALKSSEPVSAVVLRYVNRLSDWLFVAARYINEKQAVPEVIWNPKA